MRLPESALEKFLDATGAVGVRVGIDVAGSPPKFVASGLDGRSPDVAMPVEGRFRIGSLTKTFTAAIVLGLVSDGRLALDDRLARRVPSYPMADEISLRQLLTHTAGTADPIIDDFDAYLTLLLSDPGRLFTTTEVVGLASELEPFAHPGTSYRYSNTNYQLLGAVIEQITTKPFDACLDGLASSWSLTETSMIVDRPPDLAHGWFDLGLGDTPDPDTDIRDLDNSALLTLAHAAGGATSSLADLLRWGRALYLGDALEAPLREAVFRSPAWNDPEMGGVAGIGVYGFGEMDNKGVWPAYGHVGNIVGSSTALLAWPAYDAVVAVHANIQAIPADALVGLATSVLEAVRGG